MGLPKESTSVVVCSTKMESVGSGERRGEEGGGPVYEGGFVGGRDRGECSRVCPMANSNSKNAGV